MKDDYVLVAVSKNEDKVFIVKNVTKNEYKKLLNNQEKGFNAQLEKEKAINDRFGIFSKRLDKIENKDVILAKSIYDNFVDRGLIENNDQFQQMWFDFYFNGGEIDLENAPQEYKKILEKVVNKNEKQ